MLMSSLLRPVAEAAREKNLVPSLAWAPYLTSSVKASIKGWAKRCRTPCRALADAVDAREGAEDEREGRREAEHLCLRQRLQVGADGRLKKGTEWRMNE